MVLSPQEFPAYLHEIVFNKDATVYDLLTIALSFAVLWAIVFAVARPLIRSVTYGRPWLRAASEREYERNNKEVLEEWFGVKGKDKVLEIMMKNWPNDIVLNIQHVSGAIFCIPSCFGLGDPLWASSLAACGILSEMGWEIQDTVEHLFNIAKNGLQESQIPLYFILMIHHSLTSLMGVPMLLNYRNLKPLHWLGFDLQVTAAAGLIIEYSKILDISEPNDLRQFKVINFLLLALMVWTRFLHWTSCCVQIMFVWYLDKAWTFLTVGSIMMAAFSYFNATFCVVPIYKRFMKFLHVSAEYESLPPDATATKRRQSVIQLEEAAGELLLEEGIDVVGRAHLFLESLEGRKKPERRQTVLPRRRMTIMSARLKHYQSVPAVLKDD